MILAVVVGVVIVYGLGFVMGWLYRGLSQIDDEIQELHERLDRADAAVDETGRSPT